MSNLISQCAELLADLWLKLMMPARHGSYQFTRGEELIIVTVEVVRQEALEEYNQAATVMNWLPAEENATVS